MDAAGIDKTVAIYKLDYEMVVPNHKTARYYAFNVADEL